MDPSGQLETGAASKMSADPFVLHVSNNEDMPHLRYAADVLAHVIGTLRRRTLQVRIELSDRIIDSILDLKEGVQVDQATLLAIFEAASLHREMVTPTRDKHGRFDETLIDWDTDTPWISELAVRLCEQAGWELRKKFRLVVTHDIDRTTVLEPTFIGKAILETVQPRGEWVTLDRLLPFDGLSQALDNLLAWEQGEQIRSILFFRAEEYGRKVGQSRYSLGWPSARHALHAAMSRGMDIGLQGGYRVCCQGGYGGQAVRLRRTTGRAIEYQRNSYLRFDPRRMGSALMQARFTTDFSIGYMSRLGFRSGLAHEYPLFDHAYRRTMPVMEIPVIFVEHPNQLRDPDGTLSEFSILLDKVAAVRGTVAINFHPENLHANQTWFELLQRMVDIARERGAVLG
jgi:hypothetical protein